MNRPRFLDWLIRKRRVSSAQKLLSRDDYLSSFSGKNVPLSIQGYDLGAVSEYVHQISPADHVGYEIAAGDIQFIYRTQNAEFEHVLVSTGTPDAFVVVIVRAEDREIVGHHLLDLNIEYGIPKA